MTDSELVEVYRTIHPAEAEIITTMLDAEGIRAQVAGATQGGFPGALHEVTILVNEENAQRAKDLIAADQREAQSTG